MLSRSFHAVTKEAVARRALPRWRNATRFREGGLRTEPKSLQAPTRRPARLCGRPREGPPPRATPDARNRVRKGDGGAGLQAAGLPASVPDSAATHRQDVKGRKDSPNTKDALGPQRLCRQTTYLVSPGLYQPHVWYFTTLARDRREMEVIEHCTNITSPSCDVSHLWTDVSEIYELQLVGSRGNATLVRCFGSIFPELDMHLEPPEFEVAGFTDHIDVTLAFPPALPEGQGLWQHFPVVIEERLEGIVKKHKLKINEDTKGNFTYILDRLIPNTTYCVSVYFSPRSMHNVIRSPLKCTHLQPARRSAGSPEPAGMGALIAVVMIVVVFVGALAMLRRVGYICLRSVPPKVLKFQNLSTWAFPELPPLEAMAVLEVININRKKKVWDYNYDEESDGDETVVQASAGGYTMHRLAVRPVCPVSGSSAPLEDYSSPDVQEDELSEPETLSLMAPPEPRPWCSQCAGGASKGQRTPPAGPEFEEDSVSVESSADRNFFNVDLNSVFVRVLDDSDTEVPQVPSPAEETVDPEDPNETGTSLPVASAQGSQLPFPSHPGEGQWLEDAPSDGSDTSESDVDVNADVNIGDGYLMR